MLYFKQGVTNFLHNLNILLFSEIINKIPILGPVKNTFLTLFFQLILNMYTNSKILQKSILGIAWKLLKCSTIISCFAQSYTKRFLVCLKLMDRSNCIFLFYSHHFSLPIANVQFYFLIYLINNYIFYVIMVSKICFIIPKKLNNKI